jgi:AbrB family looped-hinge helix DNA binding protein
MKTTIDGAGRVIVPKKIREAAQLEAGSEIDVRIENGVIQLEPIAAPVKFKKRGHLLVATRPERTGTLTQEMVEATRESVQGERVRSGLGKTRRP